MLRKEPLFLLSDSMLKLIGEFGVLLNGRFQCCINAYGGYNLKRLTGEVQKSRNIKGYFKKVVVMVGTNDSHGDREAFDLGNMYTFIKDFKAFFVALDSCLDPEKVVILGLLPRAYCGKKCRSDSKYCRNVHKNSDTDPDINTLNKRINNMNKEIEEIVKTDIRFIGKATFCNLFYMFLSKGKVDGTSNKLLGIDRLHINKAGAELIDEQLNSIL